MEYNSFTTALHRGYFQYNQKNPEVGVVAEDSEASVEVGGVKVLLLLQGGNILE